MLDEKSAIKLIKIKFYEMEQVVLIPLLQGGFFSARWIKEGIMVDNLGFYPLLPWAVFIEVINLLIRNNGRAENGDANTLMLGAVGLTLDTIEGHIAHVVYAKKVGDVILQRLSPVSAILVWAGVCDSAPGELILR
jgi:hypothetical protein